MFSDKHLSIRLYSFKSIVYKVKIFNKPYYTVKTMIYQSKNSHLKRKVPIPTMVRIKTSIKILYLISLIL